MGIEFEFSLAIATTKKQGQQNTIHTQENTADR